MRLFSRHGNTRLSIKKRLVTFKKGITLKDLEAKAREKTNLQAAQEMQSAKAALFAMFNKPEVKKRD
jgi:hypothetical protein